jgi:hypothetical protein
MGQMFFTATIVTFIINFIIGIRIHDFNMAMSLISATISIIVFMSTYKLADRVINKPRGG